MKRGKRRVQTRNSVETRAAIAAGHEPGALARIMADPDAAPSRQFMLNVLVSRLELETHTAERHLKTELIVLRQKLDQAIEALGEGDRIDAHLIANAVMLTERIAIWNLVRELTPIAHEAQRYAKGSKG